MPHKQALPRWREPGLINKSQSHPFTVAVPRIAIPYETPGYVALLPSGWRFTEKYSPAPQHRFVTRMAGPNGISLLIDTTRHVEGDPADSARTLEALFRHQPTYRVTESFRTDAVGVRAFEWSFEYEGSHTTDIFFYKGGDGYAVLAEGSPKHATEIRAVALKISRSIQPRPDRATRRATTGTPASAY